MRGEREASQEKLLGFCKKLVGLHEEPSGKAGLNILNTNWNKNSKNNQVIVKARLAFPGVMRMVSAYKRPSRGKRELLLGHSS